MSKLPTREEALQVLGEYVQNDYLYKHALTVEGVMGYYARRHDPESEAKWRIVGLLHDLDYEKYPEEHCIKVVEILREREYPEEVIRSIVSHGYGLVSDVRPEHIMEKILFATDELCGLIHAAAIMRPSKSVLDMEPSSVKKKFKSKSFAAGVSREVINQGLEELGWTLDYAIEQTLAAMKEIADEIGLGMAG